MSSLQISTFQVISIRSIYVRTYIIHVPRSNGVSGLSSSSSLIDGSVLLGKTVERFQLACKA